MSVVVTYEGIMYAYQPSGRFRAGLSDLGWVCFGRKMLIVKS